MSDAPELNPVPAKHTEAHPLDALTGGAFSAATPGDRAACIREWLATQPAQEQLQEVFKELSVRDKNAARLVRERLDEIRRLKEQEVIAVEWAEKARVLLAAATLNVAQAVVWQREAARAGAPLSREPLASLRQQLTERIKAVEDLQHRVQVQREAAVLLAQRIEVLSTKPWKAAADARDGLHNDVLRWQEQAQALMEDPNWHSVGERFPALLQASRGQLAAVWEAFDSALQVTQAAAADSSAELPPVPVWADEIRVARGLPSQLAAPAAAKPAAEARVAKSDVVQKRVAAMQAVQPALQALMDAAPERKAEAVATLRTVLRQHGRWLDDDIARQVHEQLLAAGDSQGWQPKLVDQTREQLIAQAQALATQAQGGRKLQEALRQLREQWKQTDRGAAPNHALWKKFDEACNTAYRQVEDWLERVRAESAQHKAARVALIDEVRAWAQQHQDSHDWKAMSRTLRQFAERWRDSGHVGEKLFAELQAAFKQAMAAAEAPLKAAQKASIERRQALIAQAQELGQEAVLRIDAIKELQQRWQNEAQSVPLDRKLEQKLWDAFRKPLDDAFNRKQTERRLRQPAADSLSAYDRNVLEAARALHAANASGDVQQIRTAMHALEDAVRHPVQEQQVQSVSAEPVAEAADSTDRGSLVAKRGDDRPGVRKDAAAVAARPAAAARKEVRRPERAPRLGDAAFRAQREALEAAQSTLRKLAAMAHGEALGKLLQAWGKRDATLLPAAQDLGSRVNAQARKAWEQALAGNVSGKDASEALLRLEIAADVATPAEHLSARRMLQLQLLTRRNAPAPAQTWVQDAAEVLASPYADVAARRLQSALKVLLRQ